MSSPAILLRRFWGLAAAAALLAAGGGIFAYLVLTPSEPSRERAKVPPRLVRVFAARRGAHRMAITAYGTSRASREWMPIAEVTGRAVEVNNRFEPGETLPAGTLLVRVDPTDYGLVKDRLNAEVRSQELQAKELDRNEENLGKVQTLQKEQLALAEKDRDRTRSLVQDNAASDSALDAAQGAVVTALTALQETQNNLALIPVKRELLQASLNVLQVQLEQSERELEKCNIRLPFPARCASKAVEVDQFVAVGERLGNFLALDTAEVVAMMETRKVRALFPHGIPELGTLDLSGTNADESVFTRVNVPAEVRWGPWGRPQVWRGRVTRLGSGLDESTRALPVIVEIPDPYKNVTPGVRPPFVPDLFCHVTLFGATVEDVVVIPRDCLHEIGPGGRRQSSVSVRREEVEYAVYLLRDSKPERGGKPERGSKPEREGAESGAGRGEVYLGGGRLEKRPVSVLALEEEEAVIETGLEEGDLVIVVDLFPAADGMELDGLLAIEEQGNASSRGRGPGQESAAEPAP